MDFSQMTRLIDYLKLIKLSTALTYAFLLDQMTSLPVSVLGAELSIVLT